MSHRAGGPSGGRRGGLPGFPRVGLLCALAGLAMALAFPDWEQPWITLVAPVVLGLALEGLERADRPGALRQAFGRGWCFGVGFFGLALFWIARLPLKELKHAWVLYPGHFLLVSYLSCFTALAALGYVLLRRLGLARWLAFPLAWLGGEQLKAIGEMGFPWLSLGYAWFRTPQLIQWASWGGVAAVSLWVCGCGGLLLEALRSRSAPARFGWVLAAAGLFAGAWFSGDRMARDLPHAREIRVAIVQPNISGDIKWNPKYLFQNLAVHVRLTEEVARRNPDLIVWPETAVPSYFRFDPEAFRVVTDLARRVRIPLLTGFPDARLGGGDVPLSYNSATVLDSTGRLERIYDKMHLVPFGERMPFQRLFPILGRLDFGQAEFTPGKSPLVLQAGPARAGVLICFESIFAEPSRSEVHSGADLLVNITNDEWFGARHAPWQHASMAVFRSVENRVGMVRCANTGISFVVDPDGRIRASTPAFQTRLVVERVQLKASDSAFTRVGNRFASIMLWGLILGSMGGAARSRLTT